MKFQIQSDYQPSGDQPAAIDGLCNALSEGVGAVTLLGVTGSGKTFTMANVIQRLQRPALILSHNKTLAAQLYGEFKAFFPHNAVEYFVSYYDYYRRTPCERCFRPDVGAPGRHRHLVRLLPVRHRQSGRFP